MEVEGRCGARVCGRGHLDMGCDTISRWLKDTRVPRTTSFRRQWRISYIV